MNLFTHEPLAKQSRSVTTLSIWSSMLALFVAGVLLTLVGGAAAATTVPLGTTGSFAVLAGAGITNTGPTTINGDIGTFPTTTETGTGSLTETGTNHDGDAVTQQAQTDLSTAYNTAAGDGPASPIGPGSPIVDLGGHTLTAGVYNSASSVGLTGALTLDGGGNPDAIFVFQAGSTLTTASASQINLINGAQSCNVFWQVGSSATLGTYSSFVGTILALTSATVTTGVTIDGRVLARNGAVTLDTNTITVPSCTTPVTTTTSTATTPTVTTPTVTTPTVTTPRVSTPTATTPTVTTPTVTTQQTPAQVTAAKAAAAKLTAARVVVAKKAAASKLAAKPAVKKPVVKPPVVKALVKAPAVKAPVVKVPVVKVPVVKVPVVKVPVVKAPVVRVPPVSRAPHTLRPKPPVHRFGVTG